MESNELKKNSAYCELQKNVHILRHKIAHSYTLHGCICQDNENKWKNGVYCWWPHVSLPAERRAWKAGELCRISFLFVYISSEGMGCKAESRLWVLLRIISTQAEDPSVQNLSSEAKGLSRSPLFTDEQSLEFGSPALSQIYKWHLKMSSNFHVKTFSRDSLPKLNSLNGWKPGRKK